MLFNRSSLTTKKKKKKKKKEKGKKNSNSKTKRKSNFNGEKKTTILPHVSFSSPSSFPVLLSLFTDSWQMITLGGNAELELVDSLDPFSEGIVFSVMPPKKSWKNIANLSGGEKVQ